MRVFTPATTRDGFFLKFFYGNIARENNIQIQRADLVLQTAWGGES